VSQLCQFDFFQRMDAGTIRLATELKKAKATSPSTTASGSGEGHRVYPLVMRRVSSEWGQRGIMLVVKFEFTLRNGLCDPACVSAQSGRGARAIPIGYAHLMVQLATGEATDPKPPKLNPTVVELGRLGGLKGEKARQEKAFQGVSF
jgi:hypothetical protein